MERFKCAALVATLTCGGCGSTGQGPGSEHRADAAAPAADAGRIARDGQAPRSDAHGAAPEAGVPDAQTPEAGASDAQTRECGATADGGACAPAPARPDTASCSLDTDCLSGFCSLLSSTCVDGRSCKGLTPTASIMDPTAMVDAIGDAVGTPDPNGAGQHAGIDTCGIGESTDPIASQQHESCCKSLLVPGSTSLRMDKYEVTAGRVRQFLESLEYDVRDWALAQFDTTTWAPLTPAGQSLAGALPISGAGITTNTLYLLPHSNDATEPLNAILLTGALVLDAYGLQGCFTAEEAGGAATYFWDATSIKALAGSPPRPFTQGYYDEKPMNCIPYFVAAAFCAWDGGRLPTQPEHASVWGVAKRPWGLSTPPVLYSGQGTAAFLAQAKAKGLPITGFTADWHNGNLGLSTGLGNFYFYPSYPDSDPTALVPDTLSNLLDLSPYISAPGRFYADETTARSTSFDGTEGWQDLGADMMEWAQVGALTGTAELCDESGILGPGDTFNCACGGPSCEHATTTKGVIRGMDLPQADILGGSWEGHTIEETQRVGWSFYRQYGKTGLRCVRPAEP